MNDIIFVNRDLVNGGDARHVNESVSPFAEAAFEFEDKISAASNDAGALFFLP